MRHRHSTDAPKSLEPTSRPTPRGLGAATRLARTTAVALRGLGVLAALLGAGAVAVSPAAAEVGASTPTVQASAADAAWLAYTPPPPGGPGVVCMVDSGVDPNPDTQSAVIGAGALDPAAATTDGLDTTSTAGHPLSHGTEMAMTIAAPVNRWGMVGIAPTSVRVYSLRALPNGQTTFPFFSYAVAIVRCEKLAGMDVPAMTVISLALGGSANPGGSDLAELQDTVEGARQHGLDVVAASGDSGSPVDYPAAYPAVLAVGAADASAGPGTVCSFTNNGPQLDLLAPGCDAATGGISAAFPDDGAAAVGDGTSQATSIVSAVLASMRAYGPSLTVPQAEGCLTSTATNGSIDVAAAFSACGLQSTVAAGQAAQAAAQAPPSSGPPPSSAGNPTPGVPPGTQSAAAHMPAAKTPPRPHLNRIAKAHGRLTLKVTNRPVGDRLEVQIHERRQGRRVWATVIETARSEVSFPAAGVLRVRTRFLPASARAPASAWTSEAP